MTFELNELVTREDEFLLFGLEQKVPHNEAFGDQIGLQETEDVLWLREDIDLEDEGVIDFIENYFTDVIKTYNFIRKSL